MPCKLHGYTNVDRAGLLLFNDTECFHETILLFIPVDGGGLAASALSFALYIQRQGALLAYLSPLTTTFSARICVQIHMSCILRMQGPFDHFKL
jgi:hypothetical protein